MKIKMEVTYNKNETEDIVRAAHMARFGNAPEGMKWHIEYSYSGKYEVTAVDDNETEADSE